MRKPAIDVLKTDEPNVSSTSRSDAEKACNEKLVHQNNDELAVGISGTMVFSNSEMDHRFYSKFDASIRAAIVKYLNEWNTSDP